jgi:hypothetical protein
MIERPLTRLSVLGTLSPLGRGAVLLRAVGSLLPSPLWGEGGAQRRVRGRRIGGCS